MPQHDQIEEQIVARIQPIAGRAAQEGWSTDRTWTRHLLLQVAQLGHELGFYVCGRGCAEYGQGEWLFDLVWLQNERDHIRNVPLILECEWSPNAKAISEDFMKLLLGRARHRVMVFQEPTRKKVQEVTDELIAQIHDFQPTQSGDRFLLLGFDWTETKQFHHELFVA